MKKQTIFTNLYKQRGILTRRLKISYYNQLNDDERVKKSTMKGYMNTMRIILERYNKIRGKKCSIQHEI